MTEDQNDDLVNEHNEPQETITRVTGMYKDWFLDYASYVILERAVPAIEDGFKPVQRRIMHSMKDLDDGRYSKVANIVGHTMQYHPHGDASIADAMVQIGQKDLLIDAQGNWGNVLTGDRAAASRYIEARLSKFALDVASLAAVEIAFDCAALADIDAEAAALAAYKAAFASVAAFPPVTFIVPFTPNVVPSQVNLSFRDI